MPDPIVCQAAEVEGMVSGRTTMLRRVLKPELQAAYDRTGDAILRRFPNQKGTGMEVGNRLWVRETYATGRSDHMWGSPIYKATFGAMLAPVCEGFTPWRSPATMARRHSRLTLLVTAVKGERLQDISEADAIAEGLEVLRQDREIFPPTDFIRNCVSWEEPATETTVGCSHNYRCPIQAFRAMWDATHPPAERWSENPWVAAVAFQLIPANIDTPEAQPSGRMANEESEHV